MYKILLQRLFQVENVKKKNSNKIESSTIGVLRLLDSDNKDIYRCITIENGGVSSKESNKDRRIMPDTYALGWSSTRVSLPDGYKGRGILLKYHSKLSKVIDSKFDSRRIFIHVGNYPQDTEGCILLNKSYDFAKNPGFGILSTAAVSEFYFLIDKIDINNVVLKIQDPMES